MSTELREISIRGRLAIALHCFASACQSRGLLDHPEVQLLIDQMWKAVGPEGANFPKWDETKPLLVCVGLGDEFPPDFLAFLEAKGVDKTEFRSFVGNVVEIVFSNAYGASNNDRTLNFLTAAVELAHRWDCQCPDPKRFVTSRWADKHGWGNILSKEELADWRRSPEPSS